MRRTLRYVEPLSEERTPLVDFFSILLEMFLVLADESRERKVRVRAIFKEKICEQSQGARNRRRDTDPVEQVDTPLYVFMKTRHTVMDQQERPITFTTTCLTWL